MCSKQQDKSVKKPESIKLLALKCLMVLIILRLSRLLLNPVVRMVFRNFLLTKWLEYTKNLMECLFPAEFFSIMKAHEEFIPWAEFEAKLTALEMALNVNDVGVIRLMMQQLVAGYIPSDDIVDWVYLEQEAEAKAIA